MALKISFWATVLFLISIAMVVGASSADILPSLESIGSSSYGLGLTVFWLFGFVAMTINVMAMAYDMIRSKAWVWLVLSFALAPFTTLYYYWAVYSTNKKDAE